MGVKLSELVPKREISFEFLKDKVVGIDFSNACYQFLSSIRQPDGTPLTDSKKRITSHLMGAFNRFSNLISQGIRPVIIFDGKPPKEKILAQEERAYRKRQAQEKFEQAKQEEDAEMMLRYAKQTTRFTESMAHESKELCKAMGLPVIQAPSEADAQMAFMCEQNDIYASASSDYDCLLFGSPRMLLNLTLAQKRRLPSGAYIKITPEIIELKEVLSSLGISQDQLLVIGILTGTDYNLGGVKGIGAKTALKLVKTHKDFNHIFKEVKADFNWKKIYAVFKSMPIMKNYQLKFTEPNKNKIIKILVEEHDFSLERVNNTLERLEGTKKQKEQSNLGRWA